MSAKNNAKTEKTVKNNSLIVRKNKNIKKKY